MNQRPCIALWGQGVTKHHSLDTDSASIIHIPISGSRIGGACEFIRGARNDLEQIPQSL